MSSRPKITDALGTDAPRAPRRYDRRGRVELIDEAARALIDLGTEAGLFTGGALLAWLERGDDLARDHLEVVKPKSHNTASVIWHELQAAHQDERRADESPSSSEPSSPESE